MKKIFTLILCCSAYFANAQTVATGFDGYTGPGTEPTGWTISNGATGTFIYTGATNSGISSPSLRLDNTGEFLISPTLTNPGTVQFYAKGQGVNNTSSLLVEELVGGTYQTVVNLVGATTLANNVGATYGPYTLTSTATAVRFTYTKGVGNVAIDDPTIAPPIVLPVSLTSFTGTYANKTAQLKWNVATETNISTYIIERSADGRTYTQVGTVAATGSSYYSFNDVTATGTTNFYRLKIVGANESKFSGTVKIVSDGFVKPLNLYPSPATTTVNAEFTTTAKGTANLIVTDMNGRVVLQKATTVQEGYNNFNVDISNFKQGVYILKLVQGANATTATFSKL